MTDRALLLDQTWEWLEALAEAKRRDDAAKMLTLARGIRANHCKDSVWQSWEKQILKLIN